MRQLGCALAMLVLAATPSFAGSVLYATAASEGRIDGFCLDDQGRLEANPGDKSFGTAAGEPRRLLVAEGVITGPADPEMTRDVLYVALADRIQAFRILRHGGLRSLKKTTKSVQGMDPRDLVLSPLKNRIYVAQRGFNRVVAYDIDPNDGSLSEDFSSCVLGRGDARYVSLAGPSTPASSVSGAFLYAGSELNGRIDIYPLDATGNILEVKVVTVDDSRVPEIDPVTHRPILSVVSTDCKNVDGDRPPVTVPFSSRRALAQPKSMVLDGEMLYVEERARRRITAFRLNDGLFCDSTEPLQLKDGASVQCPGFNTLAGDRCLNRQQKRINNDKDPQQCPAGRTQSFVQYENMLLFGETLLGTQFFNGRVDGYRLKPSEEGLLLVQKKGPQDVSKTDVRTTPVRSIARSLRAIRGECSDTDPAHPCNCNRQCAGVLYVAAGSFDRVVAYALDAGGALSRSPTGAPSFFSKTDEQKNSFPNDVAVAVLPDACL